MGTKRGLNSSAQALTEMTGITDLDLGDDDTCQLNSTVPSRSVLDCADGC
jgi:hypothetical protein